MSPTRRRPELDGLRGLAVMLMIGQHLMVWLWDHKAAPTALLLHGISAAGGLAAPLFITLAGCGCALAFHARPSSFTRQSLARAGAMWGLATLLSLATPSWFTLRSFYVLHLLAVGLAIAPLCVRARARTLWIGVAIIALCTPALAIWLQLPLSLSNDWMSARASAPNAGAWLQDSLVRALVGGHFPLFPWLMPFLLGCLAGQQIAQKDRIGWSLGGISLGVGAAGLLASLMNPSALSSQAWLARLLSHRVPFFPCSPALCLALAGICLLLMAAVEVRSQKISGLAPVGRISLTVLMLHLPIFREWTRPVNLWHNLSAPVSLAVIFASMLAVYLLAKRWQPYGYRYGAEWLLRRVDPGKR